MQAARAPPREPFETNRHYVRNPHNGEWNLSIHAMIDGRVPFDYSVPVGPEKSGQLERESQRIIAQNALNTPEALAAVTRWRSTSTTGTSSPPLSRYRR